MDCQTVRDEVHVEPTSVMVRAHLADCACCAAYAEHMARLDRVVRGALVIAAPAPLSAQLATLATAPPRELRALDAAARDALVVAAPAALSARLLALVPPEQAEPAGVASRADAVLRDALVLQAPADLSARLQALVPQAAPAPVAPIGPRRWVVATVYALTTALLLLSLLYAGQVYTLVLTQFGLEPWLAEITQLPAWLLTQLYMYVPQARAVVGLIVNLRQPLQWLLVALVLWAVIDMSQRQQHSAVDGTHQYA